MKKKIAVVKIGGNVIEDKEELHKFLQLFAALSTPKVLVHGGGKMATQLAGKLGVPANMVKGRRITDAATLEVITMVYAGLANKNIVAQLQAQNCNAIGLSGADANSVRAYKRPVGAVDFGFVGDVCGVNASIITELINAGLTPVFCAITHDGKGQLLNTNADTIAAELAISLSTSYETTLYYCFEKKGVLEHIDDENSVIVKINKEKYGQLLEQGIITDGILPKMENCFHALEQNVAKVCMGDMAMLNKDSTCFTTLTL
jgi:acetylglutamate kinase